MGKLVEHNDSQAHQAHQATGELVYEDAGEEQGAGERQTQSATAGHGGRQAVTSTAGGGQNTYALVAGRNGGTLIPVRDSSSAAALVRRRWDKRSRLAREALAAAGANVDQLPANPTHWDMARHIYEQHAANAADPSERSSVASARLVLDAAYPAPARSELDAGISGATLHLGADAVAAVASLLAQRLAGGGEQGAG